MNKVVLCGRLTRDPEIRYSQSEKKMCIARYALAVDRKFKRDGEPSADFINCVAFGKLGEFAEKYLKKGTKLIVTGRIQTDTYNNRDGQKVYSIQVMVEEQEFAESKAQSQQNQPQQPVQKDTPAPDLENFMNVPDSMEDELPFQ